MGPKVVLFTSIHTFMVEGLHQGTLISDNWTGEKAPCCPPRNKNVLHAGWSCVQMVELQQHLLGETQLIAVNELMQCSEITRRRSKASLIQTVN